MLCIKKRHNWTDGQKEGLVDGQTNSPEAICPSNFFEIGSIIRRKVDLTSAETTHGVVKVNQDLQRLLRPLCRNIWDK